MTNYKKEMTPEQILEMAQEEGYELADEQLEGVSGGWGANVTSENAVGSEVRLFWCGCWDSTFRLLELFREEELVIRAMHVRDRARESMSNEISAIRGTSPLVRDMSKTRVPDAKLRTGGLARRAAARLDSTSDRRQSAVAREIPRKFGTERIVAAYKR